MSGDFKATPFARLFLGIFWKGLVRKSTIWALLIFLHSRTFPKKTTYVFPNELPNWKRIHKGTFTPKNKTTYVFPNELPHWKRIHKGTFPPKKKPMYSQMNCLIENEYIRELSLQKKNTDVFPNELPNWKRILRGKNGKKTGKKKLAYFFTGGFYYCEPGVGVLYCGGVY